MSRCRASISPARYALYDLIKQIRATRRSCGVLLIGHDLHVVMAETDTVICLNGHVCCRGTPESVARSPEYLDLFGARAAGDAGALPAPSRPHPPARWAGAWRRIGRIRTRGDKGAWHDHAKFNTPRARVAVGARSCLHSPSPKDFLHAGALSRGGSGVKGCTGGRPARLLHRVAADGPISATPWRTRRCSGVALSFLFNINLTLGGLRRGGWSVALHGAAAAAATRSRPTRCSASSRHSTLAIGLVVGGLHEPGFASISWASCSGTSWRCR